MRKTPATTTPEASEAPSLDDPIPQASPARGQTSKRYNAIKNELRVTHILGGKAETCV